MNYKQLTPMQTLSIIESYNQDITELPKLHKEFGGGMARNGSGLVYAVSYTHLTLPTSYAV